MGTKLKHFGLSKSDKTSAGSVTCLFAAYGLSNEDVVITAERASNIVFQQVCLRSGHSTYRVFLADKIKLGSRHFKLAWKRLEELGCTYEQASARLLAIDVPPGTDIYKVYSALEEGEALEIWDFEEAHYGHALRSR